LSSARVEVVRGRCRGSTLVPSTGLALTFSRVTGLNFRGDVLFMLRTPGVGILLAKLVGAVRDGDERNPRNVGLSGSLDSGRAGFIVEVRGNGFRGGQANDGEPVANGVSMTS